MDEPRYKFGEVVKLKYFNDPARGGEVVYAPILRYNPEYKDYTIPCPTYLVEETLKTVYESLLKGLTKRDDHYLIDFGSGWIEKDDRIECPVCDRLYGSDEIADYLCPPCRYGV